MSLFHRRDPGSRGTRPRRLPSIPRLVAIAAILMAPSVPTAAQDLTPGAGSDPDPYWQQQVHYTIEGWLDEDAQHLEASGTLVYENRSPDALDEVYFQLHLNAFRPHSLWAREELRPAFDFQSLEDPDFGYERLLAMRLGDDALEPEYPFAPDSTVVRFPLPETLPPGGTATFFFEWQARPSTLCRRQCREGRSWDFAHWYPRVAVYDRDGWQYNPLHPQGEFYGEYGVFDVTLDLASDQVVGATGVVLEGDPGWVPQSTSPLDQVPDRSWWYAEPRAPMEPGRLSEAADEGRKRVRFYAEDVHHFAWSTSPEYRYEGGTHGAVALHVLYRPDDLDWADGIVIDRMIAAFEWLEGVFGPYPYPQLTNVHRLEGGGTEFPMLVMNGDAGLGLIVHELAHQYAMAVLGSNEWRDAWLDEGMASFLTSWFAEDTQGTDPWSGTVRALGELAGAGELALPVATPSHEMPDYRTYSLLGYTKPSVVLYMLRNLIGDDSMRAGLSLYFERKAFQHVVEADLRRAIEDASGRDLGWFFDQWLHGTATLDYGITEATTVQTSSGWLTRVVVDRQGEAWMPVAVQVGPQRVTLEARERTQTVEVVTEERPAAVVVDPDVVLLDANPANNEWTFDDAPTF
jgi:hypothetical protein